MMNYISLNSKNPKKHFEDQSRGRRPKQMKACKGPRDVQLLKRIRQAVGDTIPASVEADSVATELKKFYPEYRRKKHREFSAQVTQILAFLKESTVNEENVQYSDQSSEISDNECDTVSYPDTNLVNQSISDMYKNSPKNSLKRNAESRSSKKVTQEEKDESIPAKRVKKESHSEKKNLAKKRHEMLLHESEVGFKNVGGIDKIQEEMWELLVQMQHPEVYEHLGVLPPRGFLLHGPPGSGKTLLAHAIAGELKLPMLKMAATELVTGVSGESEEKIRELFDQALANAPCVLFIDEIDAITPKRETAQREMERRIVAQLLMCLDELSQKAASIQLVVIGATNRADSLDPALRRAGRFDHEICLGIPDETARTNILKVLCQHLKLHPSFDYEDLAHRTPGYVGADLMALTRKAATCAIRRVLDVTKLDKLSNPPIEQNEKYSPWFPNLKDPSPCIEESLKEAFIEPEDFMVALKTVQPSAKREGFATVPDTTWDDVGALKSVREELQMAILAPVTHRCAFESMGLKTSSGILLCGPPGCGKTLLAKAIANESGLNFISVKGPELLNMYVGESERAVRQCFQRARNAAPCVIFFDEIDSLCPRRTKDTAMSGSSDRVVNQLLTEMDGMDSRKQVFVLAATNRPDIIDPAILRPGRLDKVLYVGLPHPEDRVDILRTLTKNGTKPPLDVDVMLETLGRDSRCEGFTGADLTALVQEASSLAIKCAIQQSANELHNLKVKYYHFEEALKKVHPSVSLQDQKIYERMKAKSSVLSSNV